MSFTIEQVKALRDQTGLGVVEAKEALEKHGSVDAVVDHIRATAGEEKVFRAKFRGEGKLAIYHDWVAGSVRFIELRADTDFATNTAQFDEALQELKTTMFDDSIAFDRILAPYSAELGEALRVYNDNLFPYNVHAGESASTYIHPNAKLGAMVIWKGDFDDSEYMREIALHIAGMNPTTIKISDEQREEIREIIRAKVEKLGKPEHIVEKIVDGKLQAELKNSGALLEQPFAKNPDITVGQYLQQNCPNLRIKKFFRYEVSRGGGTQPLYDSRGHAYKG